MRALLINAGVGETRIALVTDGRLADFQVARDSEAALTDNIYLGRVIRVMAAMQAAFVEIGEERAGFLSLAEARHLSAKPDPMISDCVREGEALSVQVIREAAGDKGPRLTAKVTLSPELEARRKIARPPALLERAPSLLDTVLRDLPGDTRIAIDDLRVAEDAREYCRRKRPDLEPKIEVVRGVFDEAVEEDIAFLFRPRVPLGNGGWITIERAEGFTAIDVNSGGFAASGGREETSLAVNLEAAREIGRQIRLRGIGGLIVADFIQMRDATSVRRVKAALTENLNDAPADVTLSPGGLAVITRKRVRPPLSRFLETCACCGGTGMRPAPETVALALLRAAEASARAAPGREIVARAAPEVTDWLAAHAADLEGALARRGVARFRFECGTEEGFDVTTI